VGGSSGDGEGRERRYEEGTRVEDEEEDGVLNWEVSEVGSRAEEECLSWDLLL
jgi:hypothetical protein